MSARDGAVSMPVAPLRTPACAADESGWTVVIRGDGLVQVSTGCLCGDPECGWHAATYKREWIQA